MQRRARAELAGRVLPLATRVQHEEDAVESVTSMSPLQFQKQVRLQEARRLMLGEDLDAASAGHRVGYEDPAYFSRDYKKLFGAPPHRDISKLRTRMEHGGSVASV